MPRTRTTPNLFITIPPNPIVSTHQKPITGTTTISSPKTLYPPRCCRLTARPLLRIFPWVVGCTLVLWIFVLRADRPPLRVYSPQQHPPVEGYKSRPPHRHSKSYVSSSKLTVWEERAANVRNSFIHAYNGYGQVAALYDVLLPVTGGRANNVNGWGLTLYDSLDTMWVMGLHGMFRESLGTIARASFSLQISEQHEQLYNTVLHHLGGLLSAYALSKESLLLIRADDLGKFLLPAFNSSSVIAANSTSEESSMEQNMTSVSQWATILGHQLELTYLAHLTGRIEYYNLTKHFMKIYDVKTTNDSILNRWDPMTSTSINSGHYDSAQEYLLKQWLLTAKSDSRSLALYLDSINSIIKNQLYISPNRNLLYLTSLSPSTTPTHRFHHHSCSFPALLALGVHNLGISLPLRDRELHLWAAQGLAYTCWVMYADQGSGLGGEEVKMRFGDEGGMESSTGERGEGKAGRWMELVEEWEKKGKKGNGPPGTRENEIYVNSSTAGDRDYVLLRTGYALNPDLIESFYFMWKITKSDRWRNRGWAIFEAIEKHTRTKHGYASLLDVEKIPPLMKDEMPSYFLGETLKYLYLLFCDDEPLALNSWVFNSRGHPLPVFDWSIWEKERFNITLG